MLKQKNFFKIGTVLFFIIFGSSCAHAPQSKDLAKASDLKQEMEMFIKHGTPNRSVGETGHETAFQYLLKRLQLISNGVQGSFVHVHSFYPRVEFAVQEYKKDFKTLVAKKFKKTAPEYIKWKAFTDSAIQFTQGYKKTEGKTLILEIPGTQKPKEILWIGAHYDTITHNHETMEFTPKAIAPGADDNASGVVALIHLAEYFAAHRPAKTLRFVLFDYEEIFFLGSDALANDIQKHKLPFQKKGERTAGLINLEMIGWATKNPPVVKVYARQKQAKKDLLLAKLFQGVVVLQNGFNRSDNWSFWNHHIPAVCVSEDWENDFNETNYHTDHDDLRSINFPYLERVTALTQDAVSVWDKQ